MLPKERREIEETVGCELWLECKESRKALDIGGL